MAYIQQNSPFLKKGDAPSRKKSEKNYAEVKKGGGTGAAAGGGSRSWKSERGKAARRKWNC